MENLGDIERKTHRRLMVGFCDVDVLSGGLIPFSLLGTNGQRLCHSTDTSICYKCPMR